MIESRRYLGLELAGAKNQKTALAALEYYPKEKKIFLLDIFDRIGGRSADGASADEGLLALIEECKPGIRKMGVNVPLALPPCISCSKKTCPLSVKCDVPAVRWMRANARKAAREDGKEREPRDFTPYTQRPIELWVRNQLMPKLPEAARFEVDETLGGNRAPLTARMHFLKRHLRDVPLVEVWPKLSVAQLAVPLGLSKRTMSRYRTLEEGVHYREEILETLAAQHGIFIYERDIRKLSLSLAAFDAFVCAYTALLADNDRCVRMPSGFPVATGWVQYPPSEAKG